MIWYLFLLVLAIGIAVFTWDFRRKIAAREAASKQRFEAMFMARSAVPAPPAAPQTAAPAPAAVAAETKPASPAAAPPHGRFLGQPETLVYRLLRAGIPDHEIFANVALVSVVGGRNEQEIRRLAQYRLDFVVCDKAMQVVAVVEIDSAARAQVAGEQHFIADCLKAARVNLVRVNPAALPRREAIRALVCGQSTSTGS